MKPHYRWSYAESCWQLCEGFSPALNPPMKDSVSADPLLMLRQPLLKVRELNGPRFLQCPRGESTYPVVVHAQCSGYGSVLAYTGLNRFAGLLYPFFYRHGC